MSALLTLVVQYLDGAKQIRQAVSGLSREQLTARPIAGKWSVLEVVAHVADMESILAERMKRVLVEDEPTLAGADEKRFAAALCYHDREVQEELTLIEMTRSQLARILRKQPNTVLQRVGLHTERGPLTLEQILIGAIQHIPHHVKFIVEKRQALGVK